MTNMNLNPRLTRPVYFQTTNEHKERIKQLTRPKKVSISNNYEFPEDYGLENMIAQAKEFVKQDKVNEGIFYDGISAEAITKLKNATQYINALETVAEEVLEKTNKTRASRDSDSPIQSCDFGKRVFDLDQSHLELKDSWWEDPLCYSIFVDCVSKPNEVKIRFYKPEGTNCCLDRVEKFYKAVSEIYAKILR